MKCLTWNLEWKTPASVAGRLIREQVAELDSDVVCFTEIVRAMVPEGHCIEADSDYGYPHNGSRRKVILWSKLPWSEVDTVGDKDLPPGRFASGVTGGIRFIGVCIPWKDAHVTSGRRDSASWAEHLSYCAGFQRVLKRYAADKVPICVLGDYNQKIPRVSQRLDVAKALADAIPANFRIATAGMKDPNDKELIDHIAVSPELAISITRIVPRFASDGTELSDHVGVAAWIEHNSEQVTAPNRSAAPSLNTASTVRGSEG